MEGRRRSSLGMKHKLWAGFLCGISLSAGISNMRDAPLLTSHNSGLWCAGDDLGLSSRAFLRFRS